MKVNLLCLLAVLLLLSGCSNGPEPTGPCRLTEVSSGENGIWQKITYDAEGRPSNYLINLPSDVAAEYSVDLLYNEEGRLKEMVLTDLYNGQKDSANYIYNASGRVDSVNTYEITPGGIIYPMITFRHTYNAQNQLAAIAWAGMQDGSMQTLAVMEYFYEGNTLSRYEFYEVGRERQKQIYHLEFDDKKRPAYLGMIPHTNGYGSRTYLWDFMLPQEHNLTSYRMSFLDPQSATFTIKNSYTYNAQGYPVTQQITSSDQQYQYSQLTNYTYNYACE